MKKRILSFVLVFLVIGVSIGVSSDALFSNVKIPRVEEIVSTSELSEEGVTRYVYGSGLVASVKNSEIKYYHSDRIGSNRVVTDSSGSVENEFKSLPFGQEIKNNGVRYSFATGKELDISELYYFGARYYDSNLGRFTSVDPVKENHAYNYVRNSPLNFVDPTGMEIVYDSWMWTAPVEGSFVEYYAIYMGVLDDSGDIEAEHLYGYSPAANIPSEYGQDESYLLGYDDNINYRIRVSGFNSDNMEGPKSEWSGDRFGLYDDTTGIGNEQISKDLFPTINKIYPNPAEYTQSVSINNQEGVSGTFSWKISDIRGRLMHEFGIEMAPGENEYNFNYDLPSGNYFGGLYWNGGLVDSAKFTVIK